MAYTQEVTMFVLGVAVAVLCVLNLLLELLPSPAAVAPFVLLSLAAAYYMGVVLVYLQIAPAAARLMPPAAQRRFVALACAFASAMLLLLAMPLVHVLFLAAAGR
ncbi:hypothetical protein U9M48_029421 [Paspalum notatum var. saurae]|uniref:Uncharacterized protein n=1 Tax=Paspalum notatum var. saurae TaxID=547442 RepID=A0AAQ3X2P2_PASNO